MEYRSLRVRVTGPTGCVEWYGTALTGAGAKAAESGPTWWPLKATSWKVANRLCLKGSALGARTTVAQMAFARATGRLLGLSRYICAVGSMR